MGQFLDELPTYLMEWIPKQHMFWVASAPLSQDGHVNISPKGIEGTFRVVNSRRVWYEDLSGTGAETVSHIRENGRVTILFHAFEGPARIVRLYGKGFVYELGTPEYEELLPADERLPGSRAIIGLDVTKVGTTCGYAVPYYQFVGHRTQLMDWAAMKEGVDQQDVKDLPAPQPTTTETAGKVMGINPKGMRHWWQLHNITSIDGLPALSSDFGRAFPFVFSFGRNRAPITRLRTSKARQIATPDYPRALKSDPYNAQLRSAITVDITPHSYSYAFKLLVFFLVFLIGVAFGRGYDRYYHHLSNFEFIKTSS
ncbi:hypothetical protein CPC08DRAFT_709116 [Agrocybe pediades]|nr:hypothetical protein CPC08DRAFT_709116 [Agrocybe pediades]